MNASTQTRSQKMAQEAFTRIANRTGGTPTKEYTTFAKKFPALIHTCGLAQAVAFALAKTENDYLSDLCSVFQALGRTDLATPQSLDQQARDCDRTDYLILSRDAIRAASWIKRYVEAANQQEENPQ